jgi:THO complex subunit 1
VQNVDLDIEMASSAEEKALLEDQKMSKTWRALRLMSKTKLNLFDKVDDGKKLECFLQENADDGLEGDEAVGEKAEEDGGEDEKQEDETLGEKQEDETMGEVVVKAETDTAPAVAAT